MALINCHECGSPVSTEAKACPKCGAKPKPIKSGIPGESAGAGSVFLFVGALLLCAVAVMSMFSPSRTHGVPEKLAKYSTGNPPPTNKVTIEDGAHIDEQFYTDDYQGLVSAVAIIKKNGNDCGSVSIARVSIYDGSWSIQCNKSRYEYEFTDVGGTISYKVVR
jgi:hypothetical protein